MEISDKLRDIWANGAGPDDKTLLDAADLIEELERRNRELNYELGGARRSYFEERAKNVRSRR